MRFATVLLCALLALAVPASAQFTPGAQLSYADDFDFGVGLRAMFGTGEVIPDTRIATSFDLFFPDDGGNLVDLSFWEININGHYFFPIENDAIRVYAGPGLHIYNLSADSEFFTVDGVTLRSVDDDGLGLNLLGGIEFPTQSAVTPFAELKIELGGAEQFILAGGITF